MAAGTTRFVALYLFPAGKCTKQHERLGDMESISIDAIVNTAEIIGGVAVIASLLFVARQMRENNLSAREANYIQVMQHNKDMGRLIGSNPSLASLYRRGCANFDALSADERWQFGSLMMAMFCDFNQQYTLYYKHRLDSQFWDAIENNMRFYLDRVGVRSWWISQPFEFDRDFTDYVNSYLETSIIVQPESDS